MSVNTERIQYLFRRYMQKTCTREELQELFAIIAQPENRAFLEQLMDTEYDVLQPLAAANETDWEYIFQQVTQTGEGNIIPLGNRNRFRWIRIAAAAAVVVLAVGFGGYWFINRSAKNKVAKKEQPVQQLVKDVQPGGNKAILTLADGSTITLDSAHNGVLTKQGSVDVVKNTNGEVMYQSTGKEQAAVSWNMLSTPKGGQYQLILPDGSKVWLNAASSIRYPVAFTGNERRVEITGEVYFEVAPANSPSGGGKKTFIVDISPPAGRGAGGEIEVLGTHFNVNAYNDEPAIATTLLEGKVKVSSRSRKAGAVGNEKSAILKPGEQAVLTADLPAGRQGSRLTIHDNADMELAVAWKNGLTAFKSADIKSIMRQVARWYNVEVVYEGVIPQRSFTGGMSRDAKLSELLHLLEVSKVHFRIEENKLIVTP